MQKIAVIIAAAGSGSRLGGDIPKQYQKLGDQSILTKTIEKFIDHPAISLVQVVIGLGQEDFYHQSLDGLKDPQNKLQLFVYGEHLRHLSVLNGLKALENHSPAIVLIHDGARPFVSTNLISQIINATTKHNGAIPLLATTETLKEVDGDFVNHTLERSKIYHTQTPQGFNYLDIYKLAKENQEVITDDAQLFEKAGKKVYKVQGEVTNIKITYREDLL